MVSKLRVVIGLVLLSPAMAHALGLGDIKLGSNLNQPMSADIDVVGASAEELRQVHLGLPGREVFTRYGVDRPSYLSSFTFTLGKDANGRSVIQVRSPDPVTEPFVTFLVEASWPQGHVIREYTVLLDPPVFAPKAAPAAPVAAPRTGEASAPAAGAVERRSTPVAAPAAAAGEARASAEAAPMAAGEYRVKPNDSLSGIAHHAGANTAGDVNRVMIATYRANPTAFDGNINRLRRGALLRLPGSDEWGSISASEAGHEVSQQMAAWRQGAGASHAASEPDAARLRLVPPAEPAKPTAAAPAAAPAPTAPAGGDAAQRISSLQNELAESKRLLDLKSAELAQLQAQVKGGAAAPAQTQAPAPATPPAAAPATETPPAAGSAEPAPAASPPAAKPKAPPPAEAASPGFLSGLLDNPLYLALGGAVVLLASLLGFNIVRRRNADADDEFDDVVAAEPEPARPAYEPPPRPIVVQETKAPPAPVREPAPVAATPAAAAAPAPAKTPGIDETASFMGLDLEKADPLAEADFHMAYGLYDQAADIVKSALGREPGRRDLTLKLLEVYFVWGNKDAFLDVARGLSRTRDTAPADEWEKVCIMGRQIAGDDPLFAGDAASTGRAPAVDMNLESGGTNLDLELLGETHAAPQANRTFVDLNIDDALAGLDSAAETGESAAIDPDRIDLLVDTGHSATGTAATAQMLRGVESPTVEQPVLGGEQTMRQRLDTALRYDATATSLDATAEVSLDDLGFDVDKIGETSRSLPALAETDIASPDSPTAIGQLDARARAMFAGGEQDPRATLPVVNRDRPWPSPPPPVDATSRLPIGDTGSFSDLDLDLNELARALETDATQSAKRGAAPGAGVDFELGAPHEGRQDPTSTERIHVDDLVLPDLEPVTLSEVGTKLDLARAYMDMGDPEGARSILQEVLSEGSATQKQEAQRLVETLPG